MIADGKTPFCVGLGSDAATGWPFTDWVEDYMLRLKGPEVYDQWVNHEIPFNDPDVTEVVNARLRHVVDTKGMVYGGVKSVASTPFADAGLPLLQGKCEMHRQGNFYAANWPEGTKLGPDGQVNAFYLPTYADQDFGRVTLTGGINAAAFSDRPEVKKVLEFIASTDVRRRPGPRRAASCRRTRTPTRASTPTRSPDLRRHPRRGRSAPVRRQRPDARRGRRRDPSGRPPWTSRPATSRSTQALDTVENSWPSK